ncbi:hypothetical protein BRD56_03415 [Thermoplasmatales archaeon SW_10_69_26]|nr:MAG: hypothetical protein BRD56_03415 [Thermoplasmatales archaeon SW_10_69_26]
MAEETMSRLQRRAERESQRRKEAERIAEASTRDLYDRQQELEQLAAELEHRVEQRTAELEDRLAQQSALQEISRFALQRRGLPDLAEELCRRTAAVLEADYSDVFQLDPETGDLVLAAGTGWPSAQVGQAHLSVDAGTQAGHTIRNWDATIVDDYEQEDRFRRPPLFAELDVQSSIAVVVPAPEDAWGIFSVRAREPRSFDRHDARFVQAMARVLSQAVHRQRSQRQLEEEKRRFETLVQQVEEYAIFSCDPEGHIQTWNVGAETMIGYTEDQILGEHFSTFFTEEDRRAGRPERSIREAEDRGSVEEEAWQVRKDGSRFWAKMTMTALHDEDGELQGFSKVIRDLTDRRRYEQRLEATNRRLEQFAYAASHDLQEPLRTITSYLQLLDDRHGEDLDPDGRDLLGQAREGAHRMKRLIDSLLTYARVQTESREPQPVDAHGVLEDALADLEVKIEETGARLTVEDLPTVQADPDQLAQVFRNLVSNALEYSGDQAPCIHVHAVREEQRWRFTVDDEGVGIPSEATEEIFEVFHRIGDGTGGTGIGLAICEQIVDRHGGEIWVDSEPGEGSAFHFTMPAAEGAST